MELQYIVKDELNIRQVLRQEFGVSERLLKKLKINKKIYLNNNNDIYLDKIVNKGDKIKINLDFEEVNDNIISTKMKLDILYEDDSIIALNKPPFTPVHPSLNHYEDSLSNGLKYYFDSLGLKKKIRPINRLDKDTSGIVLFAKNEYVQDKLTNYTKEYMAIVEGKITEDGIIDSPISRKNESIIERCVDINGDKALTEYHVINNFNIDDQELTLVKCILHTGRTHQIRVHMASINHPILGDTLYGKASNLINRQALHAYKVKFKHPITKEVIDIVCPIKFIE